MSPHDVIAVFDNAVCVRLMETLLHFLWQGTVIGVAAMATNWMMRRHSPHLRYALNFCAMVMMVGCVALTFVLLSPRNGLPPKAVVQVESDRGNGAGRISEDVTLPQEMPSFSETSGFPLPETVLEPPAGDAELPAVDITNTPERLPVSATSESEWDLQALAPLLSLVYFAGVLLMLVRLILALWGGRRLRRESEPVGDPRLLELVREQARRIGLRAAPRLAVCRRLAVPVVVGILRPTILLPVSLTTGLAPDQLQAILAHELAHVRRYDVIVNLLQRLIESVLFFHPAVWYVSRRISLEREKCCDDDVVSSGHETVCYAGALVRMAELCGLQQTSHVRQNLATLAASGNGSELKRRVLRLLDMEPRVRLMPAGPVALLLVLALLLTSTFGLLGIIAAGDAASGGDAAAGGQSPPESDQETSADGTQAGNASVPPAAGKDIYGDPLPEGALARLGTVRYRHSAGAGRIQFLADGRTLLGCNSEGLVWIDVMTGRTLQTVDIEGDGATLLAVTRDRSLAAVSARTLLPGLNQSVSEIVFVDTTSGQIRSRLPLSGAARAGSFNAACFTPDGARLVTGDHEGVLRVWSVANGREERSQALPSSEEVERIDISRDSRWIVACLYRTAYRWEWHTAGDPLQFGEPYGRVISVELAPDGRTVAMGADRYGGVRLFDVESGRDIRELTAPGRYYYPHQMAFTSDGLRLAVPSRNSLRGVHPESPGELDVWDVESGELLRALPFPEGLRCVAISPDDRWIAATVSQGTIEVWDLSSGQALGDMFFGHVNRFGTLAASPDGTQIATAGDDGLAVLWDAETGQPVHVLRHHAGKMVRGLAFSPDGNLMATSALDDSVVIWNRSGERIDTLPGHGDLGGKREVAFSPDSRRLLSFGDDWFLRVFDVRSGKALIEHAVRPSGLSFKENVDGSVTHDEDDMWIFMLNGARFTPDGKTLALAAGRDVYLIDVDTGEERARYESAADDRIALSPDGTRLAALRVDETPQRSTRMEILNLRTGDVEPTIPTGYDWGGIAFSPDGRKVALGGSVISVYDADTGREVARIEPETRASSGLTFTPDGERLVVTHADTTALIWDWRHFLIDEEAN